MPRSTQWELVSYQREIDGQLFRWRDMHVLPIDDVRVHEETRTCWCRPALEQEAHAVLVIHHAADGRELVEQHGVN